MNCDKFVGWISAKAPERIEASNKMTSWKRRKNYDEILAVSFLRESGSGCKETRAVGRRDVTDALIKAAADDLAGLPEYEKYETAAFSPERTKDFRKVKRYAYEMTGIVYPTYGDKNILIDFGIVEGAE